MLLWFQPLGLAKRGTLSGDDSGRTSVLKVHKRVFAFSNNKRAATDVYERLLPHVVPVYSRGRGEVARQLLQHVPEALRCGNSHSKHRQPFYLSEIGASFYLRSQLCVLASCTVLALLQSSAQQKRFWPSARQIDGTITKTHSSPIAELLTWKVI